MLKSASYAVIVRGLVDSGTCRECLSFTQAQIQHLNTFLAMLFLNDNDTLQSFVQHIRIELVLARPHNLNLGTCFSNQQSAPYEKTHMTKIIIKKIAVILLRHE